MYQKKPWKRTYRDPLADTPMGDSGELSRSQPPEETFDNWEK